jgi:hypothetical protein
MPKLTVRGRNIDAYHGKSILDILIDLYPDWFDLLTHPIDLKGLPTVIAAILWYSRSRKSRRIRSRIAQHYPELLDLSC